MNPNNITVAVTCWTTNIPTSAVKMTYQVLPEPIKQPVKPHMLYDGIVFIVWMFGIYIFLCNFNKLIDITNRK